MRLLGPNEEGAGSGGSRQEDGGLVKRLLMLFRNLRNIILRIIASAGTNILLTSDSIGADSSIRREDIYSMCNAQPPKTLELA